MMILRNNIVQIVFLAKRKAMLMPTGQRCVFSTWVSRANPQRTENA